MSLFFRLFAGVSMDEMDTLPLVPLGCWLFPIGIYLLVLGFGLGMDSRIDVLLLSGMGGYRSGGTVFF